MAILMDILVEGHGLTEASLDEFDFGFVIGVVLGLRTMARPVHR